MAIFEYLAQHSDEAQRFSAGMNSITAVWGPAALAAKHLIGDAL
jgi:hypothetical protein